jgi:ribose transport system substrate-binding protein
MKRIAALILPITLALALLTGAAMGQDTPKIGLSTINLQALFFNLINDGALEAAKELGADVQIVDSNNDPARQVRAIESFITQQKDAIIVVAIDVSGIKPALQAARDAGIPVVAIDARVDSPPANVFIGVDNYGAGVQAGEYTAQFIRDSLGGEAKIGVVGALNSFIQNQRRDGFVEVVDGAEGAEIIGVVDGQNQQEVALSAAENLVTANPDMDIIYATGEPALIGTIAAVESQGLTDKIKIVGWDLTEQVIKGIENGFVEAVVQQDPYQEGYEAVRASLDLIAGKDVEDEILIPIAMVTDENVDDFRHLFE